MKTMLDIAIDYTLSNCSDGSYVKYDDIFAEVEKNLKERWEDEAQKKEVKYATIRQNKLGELYRLLTVDARFRRNSKGEWTTRVGFKK